MYEVISLVKEYHNQVKKSRSLLKEKTTKLAVNNISMDIREGKIIGLLGINGAGKTTTIKMLSSLLKPTSGELIIDGIDGVENPFEIKKRVNMVAGGERALYWKMTAKENLVYFGTLYNIPKKELEIRISELLSLVGLEEVKDLEVEKYSKGMKQRLQIARGLINNPKYLFLDEPTLGLDVSIAREMRTYVRKLAVEKQKGLVLTTHYITEAEELCDYIYLINEGTIISQGTPHELIQSARLGTEIIVRTNRKTSFTEEVIYPFILKYGNQVIVMDNLLELRVSLKRSNVSDFLGLLITQKIEYESINIAEPTLEATLIELTKQNSIKGEDNNE